MHHPIARQNLPTGSSHPADGADGHIGCWQRVIVDEFEAIQGAALDFRLNSEVILAPEPHGTRLACCQSNPGDRGGAPGHNPGERAAGALALAGDPPQSKHAASPCLIAALPRSERRAVHV